MIKYIGKRDKKNYLDFKHLMGQEDDTEIMENRDYFTDLYERKPLQKNHVTLYRTKHKRKYSREKLRLANLEKKTRRY